MDLDAVGLLWLSCWLHTERSRPETRNNEICNQFAEETWTLWCNACQIQTGDPSSCRFLKCAISQKEYRCHNLITHLSTCVQPDEALQTFSLSLSLPLSVLLLSTSAALSFALISRLMTIDSASVKRWISLNPPEFLVEVMWVFHAVSRDEFMCVKDVRDVKEDGNDETDQTLIAVTFSPR